MKKIFSVLLVVCMVLILAPLSVEAQAHLKDYKCTTNNDPYDSTRKQTDCDIILYDVEPGDIDGKTIEFVLTYNNPTDKSGFEMLEETSGLYDATSFVETADGGTFKFSFNDGLSGDVIAFKVRFYSDVEASGADCGGNLSFAKEDGTVTTGKITENHEQSNSSTGVSAPVIILGVGIVACLVVYASTSKKTKMHRI